MDNTKRVLLAIFLFFISVPVLNVVNVVSWSAMGNNVSVVAFVLFNAVIGALIGLCVGKLKYGLVYVAAFTGYFHIVVLFAILGYSSFSEMRFIDFITFLKPQYCTMIIAFAVKRKIRNAKN